MSKPILLIDDEEQFALMLKDLLHRNGFESEYCLDPKDALQRLQNENFDLVITDYMMPGMDGAQFLEAIRKVDRDLPVIMVSGLMNMPDLIRVANIGVTLVLEKPFKTDDLIDNVARFVAAKTPEELRASAIEMEASEVDFQPGGTQYTYPSPAQVLSDASEENKRFLEELWQNAASYRHIACFAPKGAEVELVAGEILTWMDQSTVEEPVFVDLLVSKTELAHETILDRESFPKVVVVDTRRSQWDHETVDLLVTWVKFVESSPKDLSMTRILYILPTGVSFTVENLPLENSMKSLFAPECPVLLSLRERILDTAIYIKQSFTPEQLESFHPEVLLRLLHYSWPGGYQELVEVLNKIMAHIEGGDPLKPDGLQKLLAVGNYDPISLTGKLDANGFLKRRQREYINLHREEGEDIKDTLLRMGVELKDLDLDGIRRHEELVYPDLLDDNED